MNPPEHEFAAPVLRLETGLKQHYVPLPDDVARDFLDRGIKRVIVSLNGRPYRRAIQSRRGGLRFVMLSKVILREIGALEGETVLVAIKPDPQPQRVELGEEFEAVLAQDEEAAARFYSMTPGTQRSLAHYTTSAKRPETRLKRALELAHKLKTRTLHSDRDRE